MSTSLHAVSSPSGHIVIVEDSDEDFDTLVEVARDAGMIHTIHRTASGGDCLALLRQQPPDIGFGWPEAPALIVMDLNSHGIDGREALRSIKSDDRLKRIPVVVLTTSANPKDVAFCYQSGANAYHEKPVRHIEYRALLHAMLHYWLGIVTPPVALRRSE
jgi:CheY-like chemotaxis protein